MNTAEEPLRADAAAFATRTAALSEIAAEVRALALDHADAQAAVERARGELQAALMAGADGVAELAKLTDVAERLIAIEARVNDVLARLIAFQAADRD